MAVCLAPWSLVLPSLRSCAATLTKFWGSEAKGTVTITAIDAKSVTFRLAGVSLKADNLAGGSVSTGTILADGSVTVTLK